MPINKKLQAILRGQETKKRNAELRKSSSTHSKTHNQGADAVTDCNHGGTLMTGMTASDCRFQLIKSGDSNPLVFGINL
jgi:hypothetical protein